MCWGGPKPAPSSAPTGRPGFLQPSWEPTGVSALGLQGPAEASGGGGSGSLLRSAWGLLPGPPAPALLLQVLQQNAKNFLGFLASPQTTSRWVPFLTLKANLEWVGWLVRSASLSPRQAVPRLAEVGLGLWKGPLTLLARCPHPGLGRGRLLLTYW